MRKQHSAAFKAKIALEAWRETKPLVQLAAENEIHPTLVTKWKAEAVEGLVNHFERSATTQEKTEAQQRKIAELYQEIGKLTTQVNWLKKKSGLEPDTF
jgi:transposase